MTLVDETVSSAQPNAKSSASRMRRPEWPASSAIRGSYELLIASRICAALVWTLAIVRSSSRPRASARAR